MWLKDMGHDLPEFLIDTISKKIMETFGEAERKDQN